jgi:hypothetical protein
MLRSESGRIASIRHKQKMAAMKCDYLEQVILAAITGVDKKIIHLFPLENIETT